MCSPTSTSMGCRYIRRTCVLNGPHAIKSECRGRGIPIEKESETWNTYADSTRNYTKRFGERSMFRPLRVVFHLDGSGIYYDPFEPLMLDGILAAASSRWHVHGEPPARDEVPADIPLPLRKWEIGGTWGWHASALFPDGETAESLIHWRKRFRQNRVEITNGSPNLTNGVYRDWNMPLPLLLAQRMVAFAFGEAGKVRRELKRSVRWLGKKRAHGKGRVVGIDVEESEADYSLTRDGNLMRYLPQQDGPRLIRPRPPYWNIHGRVACGEIGSQVHPSAPTSNP